MPQYDYSGLASGLGRSADMISQHVMRMPQIRHQLQQEAMTAAERAQVMQAQAASYNANARESNAKADITKAQWDAAKEIQSIMEEPGTLTNTPSGGFAISGPALQKLLAKFPQLGAIANSVGSGQANLLKGNNTGFEAQANRTAAGEQNKYTVDQREQTRRTAPIELNDNSSLVSPMGDLIRTGMHRIGPDQTLLGDVPGVELQRVGQGIPKPTTPQGDSNRQRFRANIIARKAAGEITPEAADAALAEYDGAPAPAAPTPQGKTLDRATAAAILQEAGGDKAKARKLAAQRGYTF